MTADTIELLPSEILLIKGWNCRKTTVVGKGAVELTDVMTDEQLEQSIAQHGILQPPLVRSVEVEGEEQWACVAGFRRTRAARKVRPNEAICCVIMVVAPDEAIDDEALAKVHNLSENTHRQSLRPWEIAEALCDIQKLTKWPQRVMAEKTGLTRSYISYLMTMKKKAHPAIWEQFVRWGATLKIPGDEMLRITRLPHDEQLAEWKLTLEGRRNNRATRGRAKRPTMPALRKVLHRIPLMANKSKAWRVGASWGLKVALGLEQPSHSTLTSNNPNREQPNGNAENEED